MARKLIFAFCVGNFALLSWASALNFTGKIYPQGKQGQELYTFSHTETSGEGGVDQGVNTYADPSGQIVVTEKMKYQDKKLTRYELDHRQTGYKGILEIDGTKAILVYARSELLANTVGAQDAKPITRDWKPNSVIGPTLVPWLRTQWASLMKGDQLEADFFVLERRTSYTFVYKKEREEIVDGQSRVVILMKIANRFLRMLVDPLHFHIEAQGELRLMVLEGRTLPKKKVGSDFKDLDARTIYSYDVVGS